MLAEWEYHMARILSFPIFIFQLTTEVGAQGRWLGYIPNWKNGILLFLKKNKKPKPGVTALSIFHE